MEKVTGYVTGVNGNLVSARFSGSVRKNEVGFVKIGNDRLKGEVIRISGDAVSMQIYEMTNGIQVGDEVELTPERFAELSAAGYVDAAEQAAEPEPEEPEKAEADEADEDASKEAKDVHEMTAAEMRAEIESMGGFAPKKATKAQLAELLEQL